jgi:hypothetical protein
MQADLHVVATVAWRFEVPIDADSIRDWLQPYIAGGRVLCVELVAPLDVRLERNRTENRRQHKKAYWVTEEYLQEIHAAHRYDSGGAFPFNLPHLRLETIHLAAAHRIAAHFALPWHEDLSSRGCDADRRVPDTSVFATGAWFLPRSGDS